MSDQKSWMDEVGRRMANIANLAELAVSAGLNMGASFEPQEAEYEDGINWNRFKPWSYMKWNGEPPVKNNQWSPSEDELLLESDLDLNDQDDLDWFCWMTGRRHCEVFERARQLGIASGL